MKTRASETSRAATREGLRLMKDDDNNTARGLALRGWTRDDDDHRSTPTVYYGTNSNDEEENMKSILKIAAGVLLGLLVFTGVLYLYERSQRQAEDANRDVAVLKSEALASIDELGKLQNDRASKTTLAAQPTAASLERVEQNKCEALKTSYFATRNASAISRDAATHCRSIPLTPENFAFFGHVLDGTLSIYDSQTAGATKQ